MVVLEAMKMEHALKAGISGTVTAVSCEVGQQVKSRQLLATVEESRAMTEVIKIANCSGFYGDKLSAAREMVEGGPIEVLTGDYLAELTMAILYSQKMTRDTGGYVGTFLKQVKDVLASCVEKNIKIVSNAAV